MKELKTKIEQKKELVNHLLNKHILNRKGMTTSELIGLILGVFVLIFIAYLIFAKKGPADGCVGLVKLFGKC